LTQRTQEKNSKTEVQPGTPREYLAISNGTSVESIEFSADKKTEITKTLVDRINEIASETRKLNKAFKPKQK
jgi:hypothetical protein